MARKIPKPRTGDVVERVDFSRMFGRVMGIESPRKIKVRWADMEKPEETIERIKDLALVERKKRLKKVV